MLPNSKQNVLATTTRQNLDAGKKASLQSDIEKQAQLDAEEREKRKRGGGGGGGGVITKGGGSKFGSQAEINSSFIAQNYRAGVRDAATKQIMQANTFSDNAATAKLAELASANGEVATIGGESPNMANNLIKAMFNPGVLSANGNFAGSAQINKNILDDFNNPIPRFIEGAISVLASTKILKSNEEKNKETEKSIEDETEDKEELVESAIDKLTKLFPVLQAMNDTDYNGNGVFQSIKIRTSKIIKFIFNRKKRTNPQASRKDVDRLKKLIKKNLDNSQKLKKNTRKLRKSGFFKNAVAI